MYALGAAWLDRLAEGDLASADALLHQRQPRVLAEHLLCRPPLSAVDVLRLGLDGKWGPDDGRPGLAFSYRILTGLVGGPPMAGAVRCHCGGVGCPGTLAMAKTRQRWGSANGRSEPPVSEFAL